MCDYLLMSTEQLRRMSTWTVGDVLELGEFTYYQLKAEARAYVERRPEDLVPGISTVVTASYGPFNFSAVGRNPPWVKEKVARELWERHQVLLPTSQDTTTM